MAKLIGCKRSGAILLIRETGFVGRRVTLREVVGQSFVLALKDAVL